MKLALHRTGPFKILAIGPASAEDMPEGLPLAAKLILLDLPSDMPGTDSHRYVSVVRCNTCVNPQDSHHEIPRYLPAGSTQYVFNNLTTKSPPYHVSQVEAPVPLRASRVPRWKKSSGTSRFAVCSGGVIAVMYENRWEGPMRPCYEHERTTSIHGAASCSIE